MKVKLYCYCPEKGTCIRAFVAETWEEFTKKVTAMFSSMVSEFKFEDLTYRLEGCEKGEWFYLSEFEWDVVKDKPFIKVVCHKKDVKCCPQKVVCPKPCAMKSPCTPCPKKPCVKPPCHQQNFHHMMPMMMMMNMCGGKKMMRKMKKFQMMQNMYQMMMQPQMMIPPPCMPCQKPCEKKPCQKKPCASKVEKPVSKVPVPVTDGCVVMSDVPVEEVWSQIKNFGDLSWVGFHGGQPTIKTEGTGVGMTRLITFAPAPPAFPNGLVLTERLTAYSDEQHTYTYDVFKVFDFPCSYIGHVTVDEFGGKTRMRFHCFEMAEGDKVDAKKAQLSMITGNLKRGFEGIKKK